MELEINTLSTARNIHSFRGKIVFMLIIPEMIVITHHEYEMADCAISKVHAVTQVALGMLKILILFLAICELSY